MHGVCIESRQDVYSSDSTPFADAGVPAISFARIAPTNTATVHNRYDTPAIMSGPQMVYDIDFIRLFADQMVNAVICPVKREMPDKMKDKLDTYLSRKRSKPFTF
jgi:Iap family predicted aminopeptidase